MVHQSRAAHRTISGHWPPQRAAYRSSSQSSIMQKWATGSGRAVAWPPRCEDLYSSQPNLGSSVEQKSQDEDPNLTTVYPSNFKLRNEMPIEQERPQVVTSQPAFKMTKPMKMRGDSKWPPASASEEPTQQEVREFIKPKKACKDYSSFFAKHALPSSYTGYRAPPGTQHVGCGEEEGATDM